MSANHFSRATVKNLAKVGITVLGPVSVPVSGSLSYATAYRLDDNGTHKIRMHSEVLDIAKSTSFQRPT